MDSAVALVEDLRGNPLRAKPTAESFCEDFQVCLPYDGLFLWHVGNDVVVGDANQVLFVKGGEGYSLSQPVGNTFAELIVTPHVELLAELAHDGETTLATHPLFRGRSRRIDYGLQRVRSHFLHQMRAGDLEAVEAEEQVVALLRRAVCQPAAREQASRQTRRLITRTKAFLEENMSRALRLVEVAQAVRSSPAYLTDVFRRIEGVPLHAYLTQLRLARALVELPHSNDLTALALDLGFSSHSHFTAAFHRAFGCTPSRFRTSTRRRNRGLSVHRHVG